MTTVRHGLLYLLLGVDSLLVLSCLGSLWLLIRARRPILLDGGRVARIVLLHRGSRGSVSCNFATSPNVASTRSFVSAVALSTSWAFVRSNSFNAIANVILCFSRAVAVSSSTFFNFASSSAALPYNTFNRASNIAFCSVIPY